MRRLSQDSPTQLRKVDPAIGNRLHGAFIKHLDERGSTSFELGARDTLPVLNRSEFDKGRFITPAETSKDLNSRRFNFLQHRSLLNAGHSPLHAEPS